MSAEYNFRFRIDWNVPRFDLDLTAGYIGQIKVLGYPVVGSPTQAQIDAAVAAYIDSHPGALSPLSQATKSALLQIAEKVAYVDEHGQDYYDALDAALNAKALLQITAVYTQTGTVYDTDSLDSLKADLVVTAYYDDGTSADVTSAAVLSGTLAEGTSTITVTYSGKTATFTATVTAQYALYDYIYNTRASSAGDSPDYVATGLTHSPSWTALNIEFEVMNSNDNASGSDRIMGASTANTTNKANLIWYARANKAGFSTYSLGSAHQMATVTADTRAVIKYVFVDGGECYLQWNDTTVSLGTFSSSSFPSNAFPLVLCGANGTSLSTNKVYGMLPNGKTKVGYVKFTDPSTDEVVYHFKPCHDIKNDAYGFYEIVNNVFYPANSTYLRCGNWE